jgi:hypothetical protein
MSAKIKLLNLVKKAAAQASTLKPKQPVTSKTTVKQTPSNTGVMPIPLAPPPGAPGKANNGVVPLPPASTVPTGPAFERTQAPKPQAAPVPPAPKSTVPSSPATQSSPFGQLGGMLAPIQNFMEGIGVQGVAPYAGMLAPILGPLTNMTGPYGAAGITDLLFHKGKNLSTLTSGLSRSSGNIPKA